MKQKIKEKKYRRMFEVLNYILRTEIAAWGNTLYNQRIHGFGSKDFVFISTNNKIEAYINAADLPKAAEIGYKNIIIKDFVQNDLKITWRILRQMDKKVEVLKVTDLTVMSNVELGKFAKKYFKCLINVYGRFQTSVGWYTIKVEEDIRRYLAKKIFNRLLCEDVLRSLVRPVKRFAFEQEEIDWLKIVLCGKKHNLTAKIQNISLKQIDKLLKLRFPKLYQLILKHQQTYEWLNADSNLISFSLEDCFQKLQYIITMSEKDMGLKLNELINRQKKVIYESNGLIKKYKINKYYQRLLKTFQEYAYIRFCIRICWTKGMYFGQKIYNEIAKRAKIKLPLIHYCLTTELVDYLLNKKVIKQKDLKLRQKLYVIWLKNFKLNIYTGRHAEQIANEVKSHIQIEQTDYLKGDIGSPGKVTGRVKVISYDKPLLPQINAMKKGDILVAGQTRPEIIAACRKAAAIVTNEGGICSHAAVVSREFKIPSIIGTKVATDIFKDGDIIEVDANQGIVRKIK